MARPVACALLPLALLVASASVDAKPTKKLDANVAGFKLYKKGRYKEALRLFDRARKETPDNPYAWFNWGRVTAILGDKRGDPMTCERTEDWRYLALASIQRGLEIDREKVRAKILEDEPGLVPLEKTPQFAAWWLAEQALPKEDAALRAFLVAHGEWVRMAEMPTTVTLSKDGTFREARVGLEDSPLATGKWTVTGGKLLLGEISYTLTKRQWAFGEGRHRVSRLALEPTDLARADALELWPLDGDCGP